MAGILISLSRLRDDVLDLFYPPACLICRASSGSRPLCSTCESHLGRLPAPVCPRCRYFIEAPQTACPLGHSRHPGLLWAPGLFDDYYKALIHAFKFHERRDCGRLLAGRLGDMLAADSRMDGVEWITPVPLHRTRRRERGFNQSESVARWLAQRLDRPLRIDILRRCRPTASQTRLDRAARRDNVEAAFESTTDLTGDGTVLLVDDVLTTGATMQSCAGALLSAGAGRVWGAVMALAEFGAD